MYVQLLVMKQIAGADAKPRMYQPGDFVDVGKQTAMQWIAQGSARVLDYARAGLLPAASGVQPWGKEVPQPPPDLVKDGIDFADPSDLPRLTFFRTLLRHNSAPLRRETLAAGFSLLDTWQIAVPLMDYTRLANSFGSKSDQKLAESVIHDLRVPVYDTRLMFVRRCVDTEVLLMTWQHNITMEADPTLAFMRAVYTVKPLILPLPITWGNADGKDGYT